MTRTAPDGGSAVGIWGPEFDDGLDLAAEAAKDLEAYAKAMLLPNGWEAALRIERRWDLDGYPPAIVTETLHRISEGEDPVDAETAALAHDTGEDDGQPDEAQEWADFDPEC